MGCYLTLKQNILKNIICLPLRERKAVKQFHRYLISVGYSHPNSRGTLTWAPLSHSHKAHTHHWLQFTRGSLPCREEALDQVLDSLDRKQRAAPSSQVPAWPLWAWGDPAALPSDQHYFCPCQENTTSEPWRKAISNVESTRSKVKNRSGHSFTELVGRWVRGSLFLREKERQERQLRTFKPGKHGLRETPPGRNYPHMLLLRYTENHLNAMCWVHSPRQERPRRQN